MYQTRQYFQAECGFRVVPSGSEVVWDTSTENRSELFTETHTLSSINTVGAVVFYEGKFMQIICVAVDSSVLCARVLRNAPRGIAIYRYKKEIEVQTPPEPLIRRLCREYVTGWVDRVSTGYCVAFRH